MGGRTERRKKWSQVADHRELVTGGPTRVIKLCKFNGVTPLTALYPPAALGSEEMPPNTGVYEWSIRAMP